MKNLSLQVSCWLLLSALLLAANLHGQQPQPAGSPELQINTGGEPAAITGVEVWLALVDDGQYNKAWENGAKILQGIVAEKDWVGLATTKRPPLGKVVSRKMQDAKPATTFPGAPEGQYVVVRYTTEFEHKKNALETVTAALDPSGQWKVCGYYVR